MTGNDWLGIDLGTTVLKAGVFSGADGKCLASAHRRLPVRHFPDGGRELSPQAIDKALAQVVCELRAARGSGWRNIQGAGLAAQGGSSLIADRNTGQPRTAMILWNDGRTHAWSDRLAEQASPKFWRRLFLFDRPPAGLGRLCWLKERLPHLFTDGNIHIGAGEYVFHQLTGLWRQDAGNAIQIGSYNAHAKRLDETALRLAEVPLAFVAPLRNGHETAPLSPAAARRLSLPAGIPIAGPYIDQEGCYMAALTASFRPLQCSLGTAWVGNFVLPAGFTGASPSQLCLPEPGGKGHLVVQPLRVGNAAWDWALTSFVDKHPAAAFPKAPRIFARQPLPPPGMLAIPWCDQPNPFQPAANGACVFAGMNTCATPHDFVRATAAGMVFELFRMFAEAKQCGAVEGVVLGGGASKGLYFRQLIAAMFEPLPVYWQTDDDLAAARGVLWPLNTRAAQGKFTRVSSGKIVPQEIRNAYATYAAAFDRILGHQTALGAFRCRHRS